MNSEYLIELFDKIGIKLNSFQEDQFIKYYNLIIETNKVMNLTTITEWKDVILKHFVDSVALGNYYSFYSQRIADIGTGAGFPGIPLKILYPDIDLLLVDSLNKRVNFLNEVISKLKLNKIATIHGRAEEIGRNEKFRERYDLCVSRAVANLSTLSEYCVPLVREGGYFISYKSGNISEEEKQAKEAIIKLGGNIEKVETFFLPDSDIERSFIFINKQSKTLAKYPRKAGKPMKEPLK